MSSYQVCSIITDLFSIHLIVRGDAEKFGLDFNNLNQLTYVTRMVGSQLGLQNELVNAEWEQAPSIRTI